MTARGVSLDIDALGREGRVIIDGRDVSHMTRAFTLKSEVGTPTTLTLDLGPVVAKAGAGGANVEVDPETHGFLVDLGWTPPAEAS